MFHRQLICLYSAAHLLFEHLLNVMSYTAAVFFLCLCLVFGLHQQRCEVACLHILEVIVDIYLHESDTLLALCQSDAGSRGDSGIHLVVKLY